MTHLQLWSLYKKLPQVLSFPSAHISSLSPLPNSILPLLGPRGLSKSPRRSLPWFLKLCSSELVLPIPEAQMSYSLQDKGEASPLGVISRVACQQARDDKIKPCELSGDLGCRQETENKFSWILKESYPLVGLGLLVLVGVAGPWKKQKASCGPLWLRGCWRQCILWWMLQIRETDFRVCFPSSPCIPHTQPPFFFTNPIGSSRYGQAEVSVNFLPL